MRRIFTCLLCAVFAACLIGCEPASAAASVSGYGGDIRLRAGKTDTGFLLSVEHHTESPVVGAPVVDQMVRSINERQSLSVDVVSGATATSLAVLQCAEIALSGLGYDAAPLKQPLKPLPSYDELTCDVVVVGAGGAGLIAAIEAAQGGADVIVVEKLGVPGGSTLRSGGKIVAAASDIQLKYRVSDTPEALAGLLFQYADKDLGSGRNLSLAEHSADNIRFLSRLGVPLEDALYAMPVSETRRLLQVGLSGGNPGLELVAPLVAQAEKLGVRFLYQTQIYELNTNAMGEIKGVFGKSVNNRRVRIDAPSVVLATGGYSRSADLVFSLTGLSSGLSVAGSGHTGDGIEMARAAGARTFKESLLMAELVDAAYGVFDITGLIVDRNGERFADESGDPFETANRLMQREQVECWLIVDSDGARAAARRGVDLAALPSAESVAALAEELALPELAGTVARYNLSCALGEDVDFEKPAEFLTALDFGPFYAVRLTLKTYGTLGGLYADPSCRVLTAKETVIPGLFAAGELINGNYFARGFPGLGASLAQVIETGRIAGAAAAQYAFGVPPPPEPSFPVTDAAGKSDPIPVN